MKDDDHDLRARLKALGGQIDHAEARLKLMRPLTLDHKITNAELRVRYAVLEAEISKSETDNEEHDRHVGAFEHSLKLWLAKIDAGNH